MKALVIGATGAVGRDLMELLLNDSAFTKVDIFVRRSAGISHAKLEEHVVNFDKPEEWQHLVNGDVAFSCLGTTLKTAGSQEAQYKVDYTYQYNFAKAASMNAVPAYCLVSSAGANANSRLFYPRMKGELDEAVLKLAFSDISIVRPPALIRKNTDRATEKISLPIIKFLNKLGILRSQTPMSTLTVAKAMINISKNPVPHNIIIPQLIRELSV